MVQAFAILLLCQLAGDGLVHALGLPVPGPVVGLAILAIGLALHGRGRARRDGDDEGAMTRAANGLLGHLSLLFVPAAVGVVQQGPVLARNGLAVAVAVVVSTLLTLAVTAGVFVWAMRFAGHRPDRGAGR